MIRNNKIQLGNDPIILCFFFVFCFLLFLHQTFWKVYVIRSYDVSIIDAITCFFATPEHHVGQCSNDMFIDIVAFLVIVFGKDVAADIHLLDSFADVVVLKIHRNGLQNALNSLHFQSSCFV